MYSDSKEIIDFFNQLEKKGIGYCVLRDVDNCIPYKISESKDIDIIILSEDMEKFHKLMKTMHFKKQRHPWDFSNNFVFLYAMDKFEFYVRAGIHIDICYQMACRSTDHGEWVPLDQVIQKSIWKNKVKDEYGIYRLSPEDELIHLLTRCIFDKKIFENNYVVCIKKLLAVVNMDEVRQKLSLVFFKYTNRLIEQIQKEKYDCIYTNYLKFEDY